MAKCATASCPAPAVVIFTARGGLGEIRYRTAASCHGCRKEHRGWVARAGPNVTATPLKTTADEAGLLF